jgi:hypothetical protein
VLGLLRTARCARESSGNPRAARENLKIADIGPRAPRVVWLRRVYSPSEVWQVNLWLYLRENLATEQMLGSPVFGGAVLIRSDIRLWSSRCHCYHLGPAVTTVVLGVVHGTIPAIRVPVNTERRMSDPTRNAELVPRNDRGTIVTAGVEHNFRQPWPYS